MDFKVRMPTCAEWNRLADIVHGDNKKMYWRRMYSWCMDRDKDYPSFRVVRGCDSARFWNYYLAASSSPRVGFRPAFVPLSPDDTENGRVIQVATFYMDGEPVLVSQNPVGFGDVHEYRKGAKLEFGEPLDDPRYQIHAIKVDGIYIADRDLLCMISWKELTQQGFGDFQ